MARPIPKIIEDIIPDFAAGNTTDTIALSWLAPKATLPS